MARLAANPEAHLGKPFVVTADLVDASSDAHRRVMDAESLLELGVDLERAGDHWLRPLVAPRNPQGRYPLLSGERRFAAHVRFVPPGKIHVHRADSFVQLAAWLVLDLRQPGKRMPMTVGEVSRLSVKLTRNVDVGLRLDMPELDELLSELSGVSVAFIRHGRSALVTAAKAPDAMADQIRQELAALDTGDLQPGTVQSRIARAIVDHEKRLAGLPASTQQAMLAKLVTALNGVSSAIDQLGVLSADLSPSARVLYANELRPARKKLNSLISELSPQGGETE